MKFMISFIGVLTILAGVLPFLSSFGLMPTKFTSGVLYAGIIILVGIIGLVYGLFNPGMSLFGAQRFMVVLIGLLTLLGGVLPLIKDLIKLSIPTTGPIYSGIIILIGLAAMMYGFQQM